MEDKKTPNFICKESEKKVIKAKKECRHCGGRGFATSFLAGLPHVCSCVTKQIDLRTHDNKRTYLKDNGKHQIQYFEEVEDE